MLSALLYCGLASFEAGLQLDDQNGHDARRTGEVFSHVMRYPDWDDGSALAKMTQE